MKIPRREIIPDPDQPRKTFKPDKLAELKDSMADKGPDQPLIVRPVSGGKYMIVTGERRWRACENEEIECIVKDVDDKTAREMQFKENMQREDVDPVELGKAFWEYRQKYKVSQEELAKIIGVSQQTISAYESMYTSLTTVVKDMVSRRKIDIFAGRAISSISDEGRQTEVAQAAIDHGLMRPEVQQLVKTVKAEPTLSVSSIVQEVEKKAEEAKIDKAIAVIAEPGRRAETKKAFEVTALKASIAPKVAKAVAEQPRRPVVDIVSEEAYGLSELDKRLVTNHTEPTTRTDLFREVENLGRSFYHRLDDLESSYKTESGKDTAPEYAAEILVPLLKHTLTVIAKAMLWLSPTTHKDGGSARKGVSQNEHKLLQ